MKLSRYPCPSSFSRRVGPSGNRHQRKFNRHKSDFNRHKPQFNRHKNGRSTATNDPPIATKSTPATANPNVFNECVDASGRKKYFQSPSLLLAKGGPRINRFPTRFQSWQMVIQSWQKAPNPNVFNAGVNLTVKKEHFALRILPFDLSEPNCIPQFLEIANGQAPSDQDS